MIRNSPPSKQASSVPLDLAPQLLEEGEHEVVALLGAAAARVGLHHALQVQELLEEVVVGRVLVAGAHGGVLRAGKVHRGGLEHENNNSNKGGAEANGKEK